MAVVHIKADGETVGEVEPSGDTFLYNGVYFSVDDFDDDYYDAWEDELDVWDYEPYVQEF